MGESLSEYTFQTLHELRITPTEDAGLKEALCRCFPEHADIFSVTRAWHGSEPAFTVVMREQGRIIAHVAIVERVIGAGNVAVRAAGVMNVGVAPERRGKRLVDQIMRAGMEEASRQNFGVGLLFCLPPLVSIYARTGWVEIRDRAVARVEGGRDVPLPGDNVAMYLPLRLRELPAGEIHLRGNDW